MNAPEISVIIPHYDDLARLDLCLDDLQRQSCSRSFEVVVADNGSPCGPEEVARVIGERARLVIAMAKGAGPARNAAAEVARGRIFAFTDADCRPAASWLGEGVRALKHWDVVGGQVEVMVEDERRVTGAEAFERVFAFDNERYVRESGFTVTANLFCSREVFGLVGGFRVGVSEDLEWCHRAREAGFRLGYAAGAVVGHPARRNWKELKTKWRRLAAESFALFRQKPGGRLRWLVRSWALPLSALLHTPRVLLDRRLASIPQRLGALITLYRLRIWRFVEAHRLLIAERND